MRRSRPRDRSPAAIDRRRVRPQGAGGSEHAVRVRSNRAVAGGSAFARTHSRLRRPPAAQAASRVLRRARQRRLLLEARGARRFVEAEDAGSHGSGRQEAPRVLGDRREAAREDGAKTIGDPEHVDVEPNLRAECSFAAALRRVPTARAGRKAFPELIRCRCFAVFSSSSPGAIDRSHARICSISSPASLKVSVRSHESASIHCASGCASCNSTSR